MNSYNPAKGVKIFKGDCLEFLRSLESNSVDLIVTDPAYSGMNNQLKLGRGRIVGRYKDENNEKWFPEFKDDPTIFLEFLKECRRVLKEDRPIYIMIDSFSLLSLGHLVREVFNMKNILVWDKVNIGMGHHFRRRHEFILFASKGKHRLNARNIPDIWKVKRVSKATYPTQKPVEIFSHMLNASAQKGYTVCDPFLGSGSSAIASIKADCNFLGADVSDKAIKTSLARIKEFTKSGRDPLELN